MDGGSAVFAGAKNGPFILNIKKPRTLSSTGLFFACHSRKSENAAI
jgi:hypothetical protein